MTEKKNRTKAVNDYNKNNYDAVRLQVPKGKKEVIRQHAKERGYSLQGFINKAIDEKMERDT